MIQLVATFTDENELNQLRRLAAGLNLCQIGRVSNRQFYRKVKFLTVNDNTNTSAKQGINSTLERNKNKYSE